MKLLSLNFYPFYINNSKTSETVHAVYEQRDVQQCACDECKL